MCLVFSNVRASIQLHVQEISFIFSCLYIYTHITLKAQCVAPFITNGCLLAAFCIDYRTFLNFLVYVTNDKNIAVPPLLKLAEVQQEFHAILMCHILMTICLIFYKHSIAKAAAIIFIR